MTVDAVCQRLDRLAGDLAVAWPDDVEVHRGATLDVELRPRRAATLPLCWFDDGESLQVETLGGPGGRWELDRTEADAVFLEDLVRSVVAGRVVEVFGGRDRSRVVITLSDGSTATETGYAAGPRSLVPRPGWRRRGKRVQYAPYGG